VACCSHDDEVHFLSSNGVLLDLVEEEGLTVMRLPVGYQPRVSLPYQFFNLVILSSKCGLSEGFNTEVSETLDLLSLLSEEYRSSTAVNPAKKLAMELGGYVPFIYGPKLYEGVVYWLGTQLNENSKVPASSGFFPEVFYNVVMGSEASHQILDEICVALVRDPIEERVYAGKIATFKELFIARGVKVIELEARGKERLSRMMSILLLGDYMSAYLALLYRKDPSMVDAISRIKQRN
jgi:glucose/mannose-6-phosphate isomerase